MRRYFFLFPTLILTLISIIFCTRSYAQPIIVEDVEGYEITLAKPAERVIALAPNLVENISSAGGFGKLIAVVEYSNFPVEANNLPKIGSYRSFNYEQIVALKPDLVIAWLSGNGDKVTKKLRTLGINVLVTDPKKLIDVAHNIRLLGTIMGTSHIAEPVAAEYQLQLQKMYDDNKGKPIINSFYQVWHKPLQTLTKEAPVSQIIELCGGNNIYANELGIAPIINIESIIQQNPDAIIASQADGVKTSWKDYWVNNWPTLDAVRHNNLIDLPSDESKRPTVRLLQAANVLCDEFDRIRQAKSGHINHNNSESND